ncbi:hypothetical protein [Rhizobium binae]|uniref:hypothetical protein n=1 Tax=Rhizobium binae TaxID=1138190 RepID=UPI003DA9CD5C
MMLRIDPRASQLVVNGYEMTAENIFGGVQRFFLSHRSAQRAAVAERPSGRARAPPAGRTLSKKA